MKRSIVVVFMAVSFLVSCEQKSLEESSTGNSFLSLIGLQGLAGQPAVVDTAPPVITLFSTSGPNPTVTSLVPLDLVATDDVGITGWMITESATVPLPTAAGWLAAQPASYTITSGYGTYELYAWARDLAGNVSAVSADTHFSITYTGAGDGTPPVVTSFTNTSTNPTGISLIPVDIIATDNVAVTGYIITETPVTPLLTDPNWSAGPPASYTISTGYGTYTLYAWVRDLAGNISLPSSFSVTYEDQTSPDVTINQAVGQVDPTNALPVSFTVVFSEAINPATFTPASIAQSGSATATAWTITDSGDQMNFTVDATAVTGTGTVVPSIAAGMVQDMAGNSNNASSSLDNSVTYDTTSPSVTINQDIGQADPTNALPISFAVVFSKAINPATFTPASIAQSGSTTATAWTITDSGDHMNFTVDATAVTGTGTVVPSIPASMVQDTIGNNNTASMSLDNSVVYDATPPTVTVNQAGGQADPTNALPLTFAVVFSKAINPATFTPASMAQSGSATATAWTITDSGDHTNFTVSATATSGAGTIIPSMAAGMVQDAAGNGNTASTSTDNSVLYDTVAPVVFQFLNAGPDPTTDQVVPLTVGVTDPVGTVTGWMITQSATAPLAGDPGWLGAQPSSYLLKAIPAVYVLYLWAKDSVGNVSASLSLSVEYQLPAYSAKILETGQIVCYNELGAGVPCAGTGQDGELLKGVSWASPRFTDNLNGTITDNSTGLIWTANANLMASAPYNSIDVDGVAGDGLVYWQTALNFVAQLRTDNYGTRSDWRLPNILELMSLMNYGTNNMSAWLIPYFTNLGTTYWSSTSYRITSNQTIAWTFNFTTGLKGNNSNKSTAMLNALAVAGTSTILPRTGQITCWDSAGVTRACAGTGEDGEYQAGIAWPGTRFTHNGDGTTTDNLTGLMWTTDKNLLLTAYPSFDVDQTVGDGAVYWENALAFIDQINSDNYAGYSDWRLPNTNELLTVFMHEKTFAQMIGLGFINGGVQTCWASTTSETTAADAYLFNILYGNQSIWLKTGAVNSDRNVWPVRGGN